MKYFFFLIIIMGALLVIYQIVRVKSLIKISKSLVGQSKPFQTSPEIIEKSFLFIGDSLSVGVGSSNPSQSIAGLFSKLYPAARIKNISVSGSRMSDGLLQLQKLTPDEIFDIIFIQLGANDIVHMTSLSVASTTTHAVLEIAREHAQKVVFYTSGSIGSAPLIPPIARGFYERRSKRFFTEFTKIAKEDSVIYVDLYYLPHEDPFRVNPSLYYASDSFHVNDAGYALWFDKIREAIKDSL